MKGEFCRLKEPERASQGGDQIYFNRYVDIREVRMNKEHTSVEGTALEVQRPMGLPGPGRSWQRGWPNQDRGSQLGGQSSALYSGCSSVTSG